MFLKHSWIKGMQKKIEMYLSLRLGFLLFPKFLEYWKLTYMKKLISNYGILFRSWNQNAAKISI